MLTFKTKIKTGTDLWAYSGSEVIGAINASQGHSYETTSGKPIPSKYYTWHLRIAFPAEGGTEATLELAKAALQVNFDAWCKRANVLNA